MSGSRLRFALALSALTAVAACNCDVQLIPVSKTTLTIISPQNNASYGGDQSFTFEAMASNAVGVSSLALYGGATPGTNCAKTTDCGPTEVCDIAQQCIGAALNTCTGTKGEPSLSCSVTFPIETYHSLIVHGQITLTAIALDEKLEPTQAIVNIDIKPLTIVFTAPTPTAGTNPPVADVVGTSPVAVAVTTSIPLASVTINADDGVSLGSWLDNPTETTFSMPVNWATALGGGLHKLTATAKDTDGNVSSAILEVQVEAPTIKFTMPTLTPGTTPAAADVAGSSPVAVAVTSTSPVAQVVNTYDGGMTLASWLNDPTGTTFQQTIDWTTKPGLGLHHLVATLTTTDNETATASLDVQVGVPTIAFTLPVITPGTTPAEANVTGTSPVAVTVTTPVPLTLSSVVITSGTITVAKWSSNLTGTTFQKSIDWETLLGVGMSTLTATGTWSDGETAIATLIVNIGVPTIAFTAPTITAGTSPAVADVSGTSPVAVAVGTPSSLTLSSVVITSGATTIAQWTPNPVGTTFEQSVDWMQVLGIGTHTLTATGKWSGGNTAVATLVVQVGMVAISFTQPTVTPGTNPLAADVSGSSPVAVAVVTPAPLTLSSVVIKSDNGATIASWTPNPVGAAFSSTIAWATAVGVGDHLLTATGTWSDGETAMANLEVDVAVPPCTTDANCPTGDRCCTTTGTCNPIVAADADCDCTHPCPLDQGCFPGICGATPSQCRPGCNPGSHTGIGALPAACAAQNGQPSFCNPLPASQVTAQNMGGACQLGDNCSVTAQNCPPMPLDRSQPASATNPVVAYSCIPFAPNLNGCYPAGTLAAGATNCGQNCGGDPGGTAGNCAQGLECVQAIGINGPLGPPACLAQCGNPSASGAISTQCPGTVNSCEGVYEPYGAFEVNFTTGTCCENTGEPCTTADKAFCCSDQCVNGKCR